MKIRESAMLVSHIRTNFTEAFFPRLSEWAPALMITALGWVLMINETLMQPSSKGYTMMLQIADQETWAVAMLAFGVARLAVLLINGAWRRSPHARALAAALSM